MLQTEAIAEFVAGDKAKLNNFAPGKPMAPSRLILRRPRALGNIPLVAVLVFGWALCVGVEARAQTPAPPAPQAKQQIQQDIKKSTPPLKGETPATVLDGGNVSNILGMQVRDAAGHDMGRIVDLLGDRNGEVRAAIIDFGGFLGVGSRKVAVDWHALHFPAKGQLDNAILALSRDAVTKAPEYKRGEPIVVLQSTRPAAPEAAQTVIPNKATATAPAAKVPTPRTPAAKTPAAETPIPNTATPKSPAPPPLGQTK